MIPEKTIQEILQQLDMVEVMGSFLSLKKTGKHFKAVCPFHQEKTPSFVIYPEKQFFICYGCGVGGDLIAFIMRHEHLEFPEAIEYLANKAGIEVQQVSGGKSTKEHLPLYKAHEVATEFFQKHLQEGLGSDIARDYLKRRSVSPEATEKFQLGFAPSGWDGLLNFAKTQELTPEILEKSGLAIERDGKEGHYDRFRNRVIFPIWDARGKVIAFGARALDDKEGAKYINSPETPLYTKGNVLYGLHLAAPTIRDLDFCIVVEGYMDVLTPSQHGIKNIVASMGTALTPAQVKLIRRHTKHVVMVYDGDAAGEMATLKGLDLFVSAEMRVKVATLPGGLDPDTLVQEQGIKAFAEAIQQSQELFDYKLAICTRRFDAQSLEGRVQICAEMLPTIKRVPNAIQKGEYVRALAQSLSVDEDLLWKEMDTVKVDDVHWEPVHIQKASGFSEKQVRSVPPTPDDLLISLLVESPRRIAEVEGRLDTELILDDQIKTIYGKLVDLFRRDALDTIDVAQTTFFERSEQMQQRWAQWLAWAHHYEDLEKEKALDDAVRGIQKRSENRSLEDLQQSIRDAEAKGDEEAALKLILEYNSLMKSRVAKTPV